MARTLTHTTQARRARATVCVTPAEARSHRHPAGRRPARGPTDDELRVAERTLAAIPLHAALRERRPAASSGNTSTAERLAAPEREFRSP